MRLPVLPQIGPEPPEEAQGSAQPLAGAVGAEPLQRGQGSPQEAEAEQAGVLPLVGQAVRSAELRQSAVQTAQAAQSTTQYPHCPPRGQGVAVAERQPRAQAQALQAQVAAEEPQQSAVLLAQAAQPMIQYLRCQPQVRAQEGAEQQQARAAGLPLLELELARAQRLQVPQEA